VAARPTAAARPATAEPLDDQTEPDMPSYVPSAGRTVGAPDRPGGGSPPARRPIAPSQAVRPLPIVPGSAAIRPVAPVETLAGPFPRIPSPPATSNGQRAMPPPHPQTSPIARAPVDGGAAPPPIPARHSQAVPTARPPIPPGERTPAPERIAPERTPIPERVPGERTPPPIPGAAAPRRPAPAGPPGSRTPPPERMTREPASVEAVGSTGFPRHPAPPRVPGARPERSEHPEPEPRQAPPPGMSDADVNALYAKYIKAKQILGEDAGPGAYTKLLRTINAQAPKIMEQYRSRGVDFSVVVKDNQVIIRAKPKP
jgi:hypothetical protein